MKTTTSLRTVRSTTILVEILGDHFKCLALPPGILSFLSLVVAQNINIFPFFSFQVRTVVCGG